MALAKALTKFAKDVPAVQFKGALLDGQVVAGDRDPEHRQPAVARGADREAAVPDAVARSAAWRSCSTATIRNLAVVLDQIAKQKGGEAPKPSNASRNDASNGPPIEIDISRNFGG